MASARFALWNACQPLSSRPAGQQTQDVQACLAAGADPDEREPPWMSATFILLVTGGEHEAARLLLEAGAGDARAQVLHLLLMPERPLTMAKVVLDYARDKGLSGWVDVRDPGSHDTPLLRASRMGQLQGVSLFLEYGADVRAVDFKGHTALHRVGSPAVARLLVKQGADANAHSPLGTEPLHCATTVEVVDALLDSGAHIDAQDARGYTPAVRAVVRRKPENAMRLVERGADVTLCDQDGHALLDHAVQRGYVELVRFLLGRNECSVDDVDVAWAVQDIDDNTDCTTACMPFCDGRLLCVHFPVTFTDLAEGEAPSIHRRQADRTLKARLMSNLPGALKWLVTGSVRWYASRSLRRDAPEKVRAFSRGYLEEQDRLATFIRDRCDVGEGYRVGSADFLEAFRTAAEDAKVESKALAAAMRNKGFAKKQARVEGVNTMAFCDIRLKPLEHPPMPVDDDL
jgi:hypothetical protein